MQPQASSKSRAFILDILTPIFIVIVFGGVVVPSFFYLIQPQLNQYFPGGMFHVGTQADLLKGKESYLADLRSFSDFYKEKSLSPDSELSVLVPMGGKTEELFGLFEAAGTQSGASLQVIDVVRVMNAKTQPKEGIQDITLNIKYAGLDYETFKQLLKYFETSKRLIDITAFSFDPVGRFASFSTRVYYTPEKKR